jgi:hypothetical protein
MSHSKDESNRSKATCSGMQADMAVWESNPQPSDHGSKTLTTRPRRPSLSCRSSMSDKEYEMKATF